MSVCQGQLFETEIDQQSLITRVQLSPKQSTFKGGLATAVHRWFRLTPSFSPELVVRCLEEMDSRPGMTVFDPFSGAGTTLIQAKLLGYRAIGFEVNPLLAFVCSTSLNWELDANSLRSELTAIRERFESLRLELKGSSLEELGYTKPPIHNIHRWWRDDVLDDLLVLLSAIRSTARSAEFSRFFELALAGVLVPDLTNVTLGRLQLFFIDRSNAQISVWNTFCRHADEMILDISRLSDAALQGSAEVHHVDSTNATLELNRIPKLDRVITSPPYPNRYSYVWNTRPHLYLLGLITEASEASRIDKKAIGGTWGTATSDLQKGVISASCKAVDAAVSPLVAQIREQDNLMANYVMHYFNQLTKQIVEQHESLTDSAQLAYVVGCSRTKNIFIETDSLLAEIFCGLKLGYSVKKIERFRKRNSGKDLHESTVYVQRQ